MQIKPKLVLQCHYCIWRPPESDQMSVVLDHMVEAHQLFDVKLDLAAVCGCGETMKQVHTSPMGGRTVREWFICTHCGNTAKFSRDLSDEEHE